MKQTLPLILILSTGLTLSRAQAASPWCSYPPSHPVAPSQLNAKTVPVNQEGAYDTPAKLIAAHHDVDQCLAKSAFNLAVASPNGVQCLDLSSTQGKKTGAKSGTFSLKALGLRARLSPPIALYSAASHGQFALSQSENCKTGTNFELNVMHVFQSGAVTTAGACRDVQSSTKPSSIENLEYVHFGNDAKSCLENQNFSGHANRSVSGDEMRSSHQNDKQGKVLDASAESGNQDSKSAVRANH